jgi:hypothetical protein
MDFLKDTCTIQIFYEVKGNQILNTQQNGSNKNDEDDDDD